jgi:predicted ribosomally synthesized peptide with SipW-like signal peptide
MANDNTEEQTHTNKRTTLDLSRRKILAGIGGGVGIGTVLGGGATWALLQDQETFQNNQLVVGELDLKVTWQQTVDGDPVNAFPDSDDNGERDPIRTRQEIATDAGLPIDSPSVETTFRNQFADVPDDIEAPVIDLQDVKPGRGGEITFGLHLFDNDGKVVMSGNLLENAENSISEPEGDAEAGDSNQDGFFDPVDSPITGTGLPQADPIINPNEGELADAIQAEIVDSQGNTLNQGTLRTTLFALSECGSSLGILENSTTHEVTLRWNLPETVGDEIQTDSVTFDLSFFARQFFEDNGNAAAGPNADLGIDVNVANAAAGLPGAGGFDNVLGDTSEVLDTKVETDWAEYLVHNDGPQAARCCVTITFVPREITDTDAPGGPVVEAIDKPAERRKTQGCVSEPTVVGAPPGNVTGPNGPPWTIEWEFNIAAGTTERLVVNYDARDNCFETLDNGNENLEFRTWGKLTTNAIQTPNDLRDSDYATIVLQGS